MRILRNMTTPILSWRLYISLVMGLLLTLAVFSGFVERRELLALGLGYLIFALNYLLIAKIYMILVLVFQHGHGTARTRLLVTLGTGIKFVGLIGTLYLLLVHFALPGLYLAAGSLISLFVLTWILVLGYLRTLNLSQRS